ncbi:Unknown protein, partial [Striga hermonthica]
TDSWTSSRDDDDERSGEMRATRTTRHHGDRRTHGHRHHREEHVRAKSKITMPTFEGVDPDAWLSRAVKFFEINEVHKSERVQIAAYYLDGEANTWWQWVSHVYKNKGEQIRWRDIEKELIARFGYSEYFDYDEALTRIRQTGSLRDYQKEFERIASRVQDWPEKALVGAFVGGLKAELAAEVRLDRPRSTRAAMEAARLHEDHLAAVRRARPSEGRTNVRCASVAVDDTPPRAEVKPTVGDGTRTTSNYRWLTEDEIQRRREKGLCFTCNEKFGKGKRRCREDSEERSDRDEEGDDRDGRDGRGKRPRKDGDRGGERGETPVKRGTIYMISGGPTDGNSNNARKEHARAVKRKKEEVGITVHMPVISFKAADVERGVLPHNDALVITAEVAGFDVKRVFIDTGSLVDVMFYDSFSQINIELNMELKPVATALYGFNGGEVMPIGEVSLPVALGSGVTRKVWMVRFVVVGAESSYNIIMGRTSLNAFQAVVSTYHMMIKYPVGENVGEIVGNQLTSRSCYQTT